MGFDNDLSTPLRSFCHLTDTLLTSLSQIYLTFCGGRLRQVKVLCLGHQLCKSLLDNFFPEVFWLELGDHLVNFEALFGQRRDQGLESNILQVHFFLPNTLL